jgi:hypothetical protein
VIQHSSYDAANDRLVSVDDLTGEVAVGQGGIYSPSKLRKSAERAAAASAGLGGTVIAGDKSLGRSAHVLVISAGLSEAPESSPPATAVALEKRLFFDDASGEQFASETWAKSSGTEEILLYRRVRTIATSGDAPVCASANVAVPTAPVLVSTPSAPATAMAFEMYLDCDTSTGAIEAPPCVFPGGTTTVDIGIVLKNSSGADLTRLGALNFSAVTNQQSVLNPTAPACLGAGLDCNPDFNQAAVLGSFSCAPPLPVADSRPLDPNLAQSDISCFNGSGDGPALANGGTITLATVHYISSADGVGSFSLAAVSVYDDSFSEIMSCNPVISNAGTCFDTTIQIGNVAATATP